MVDNNDSRAQLHKILARARLCIADSSAAIAAIEREMWRTDQPTDIEPLRVQLWHWRRVEKLLAAMLEQSNG